MQLLAGHRRQVRRRLTPASSLQTMSNSRRAIRRTSRQFGVLIIGLKNCLLVTIIVTATITTAVPAYCKSLSEQDLLLSELLLGNQQEFNINQYQDKPQDLIRLMSDTHWVPVNQRQQQQHQRPLPLLQASSEHDQVARIAANLVAHEQQHQQQQQTLFHGKQANNNIKNSDGFSSGAELNAAPSSGKPTNSFTQAAAIKTDQKPCDKSNAKPPTTDQPDRQTAASSGPETVAVVTSPSRQASLGLPAAASGARNSSSQHAQPTGDDDQQNDDSDSDDGDTDQDSDEESTSNSGTGDSPAELLASNESVSHESAMPPPSRPPAPLPPFDSESSDSNARSQQRRSRQSYSSSSNSNNNDNDDNELDSDEGSDESASGSSETPPDEAAARREQEAAEASEAEAADRSALAEQQQAQREIILAQAESEAKAIKEQQEALLKQQQLQQQMLLRRHQNFFNDDNRHDKDHRQAWQQSRPSKAKTAAPRRSSEQRRDNFNRNKVNEQRVQQGRRSSLGASMDHQLLESAQHQFAPIDNQFSDQLEHRVVDHSTDLASESMQHLLKKQQQQQQKENRAIQQQNKRKWNDNNNDRNVLMEQSLEDDLSGDYSIRQPQHSSAPMLQSPTAAIVVAALSDSQTGPGPIIGARFNLTTNDLLTAAQQHHYGAYYGSLGGYHHTGGGGGHGGYYQFAESHKKGQFDSGFKRGNKKFVISGHSSQNKGHAEGHVKWHGKKGKGTHYWDYQHKNKKHYGGGDSYGGGHHHY